MTRVADESVIIYLLQCPDGYLILDPISLRKLSSELFIKFQAINLCKLFQGTKVFASAGEGNNTALILQILNLLDITFMTSYSLGKLKNFYSQILTFILR